MEEEEIPQFAKRIKEKFPDYAEIDDIDLVERVVRKFPVYASKVKLPAEFRLLQTTSGYKNIDDLYETVGREENVDPNLLLEQGRKETAFTPDNFYGVNKSSAGAVGAGQFMKGTAPTYGLTVNENQDDRKDPIKSVRAQAKYMRKLLDQFDNDEELALAGYNSGEYRDSLKKGQIPNIAETKDYVKVIRENLQKARSQSTLRDLLGKTVLPPTNPNQANIPIVSDTPAEPTALDNLQKELEVAKTVGNKKEIDRITQTIAATSQPTDPNVQTLAQPVPPAGRQKPQARQIRKPSGTLTFIDEEPQVNASNLTRTGQITLGDKTLTIMPDKREDLFKKPLAEGEYLFYDDEGETYIVNPTTGEKRDDSMRAVLNEVPVKLATPGTRADDARIQIADQVAKTISEEHDIPPSDVVEYYRANGFTDWQTGQPLDDTRLYPQSSNDTLKTVIASETVFVTRRVIERMKAFSVERRKQVEDYALGVLSSGKDITKEEKQLFKQNDVDLTKLAETRSDEYRSALNQAEAAKKQFKIYLETYEGEGAVPYVARVKAMRDMRWIDQDVAEGELENYKRLTLEARANLEAESYVSRMIQKYGSATRVFIERRKEELQAEAAKNDIAKMPWDEYLTKLPSQFGMTIAKSAASIALASTLRGLVVAGETISDAFGGDWDAKDHPFYQFSEQYDEMLERSLGGDKRLQSDFWAGTLPQALGSTLPMMFGGVITNSPRATIALLSTLQMGGDAYKEAIDLGASEDDAQKAALLTGGLLGWTEVFGIGGAIARLNKGVGGTVWRKMFREALNAGAKEIPEEMLQEGTQTVVSNTIAEAIYDPGRKKDKGLADALLAAGISAGLVSTAVTTLNILRNRQKIKKTIEQEEASGAVIQSFGEGEVYAFGEKIAVTDEVKPLVELFDRKRAAIQNLQQEIKSGEKQFARAKNLAEKKEIAQRVGEMRDKVREMSASQVQISKQIVDAAGVEIPKETIGETVAEVLPVDEMPDITVDNEPILTGKMPTDAVRREDLDVKPEETPAEVPSESPTEPAKPFSARLEEKPKAEPPPVVEPTEEPTYNKMLDQKVKHKKQVMTRKEFVDSLIGEGYTEVIKTKKGNRAEYSLDNEKGEGYILTKAERDYAESALKDVKEKSLPESEKDISAPKPITPQSSEISDLAVETPSEPITEKLEKDAPVETVDVVGEPSTPQEFLLKYHYDTGSRYFPHDFKKVVAQKFGIKPAKAQELIKEFEINPPIRTFDATDAKTEFEWRTPKEGTEPIPLLDKGDIVIYEGVPTLITSAGNRQQIEAGDDWNARFFRGWKSGSNQDVLLHANRFTKPDEEIGISAPDTQKPSKSERKDDEKSAKDIFNEELEGAFEEEGKVAVAQNEPRETNESEKRFYDINNLTDEDIDVNVSKPRAITRPSDRGGGKMFDEITVTTRKRYKSAVFPGEGVPGFVKISVHGDGRFKVADGNTSVTVFSRGEAIAKAKTILAIKDRDENAVISQFKNTTPPTIKEIADESPNVSIVQITKDSPTTFLLGVQFAEQFKNGESFKTIVDARKFAEKILDREIKPGTADAKMIDEAIEVGVVIRAREIAQGKGTALAKYVGLTELYGQQPNLSVRTSTSIEEQAYSTPAPLAFVASQLAGITDKTSVYEPTAGNGMLLMEAPAYKITANELNLDRATNLRQILKSAFVTDDNATTVKPDKEFDVIIANPPFGTVKEGGQTKSFQVTPQYKTNSIDHVIALNALDSMKPDGRAVLIVGSVAAKSERGRSDSYNSKDKRGFYYTLYNEYNVVEHFTVDGKLYSRQGANFPVDVIVIEGKGKSMRSLPAADVPKVYSKWTDLAQFLGEKDESLDAEERAELPDDGAGSVSASDSGQLQEPTNREGVVLGESGDTGRGTDSERGRAESGDEQDIPETSGRESDRGRERTNKPDGSSLSASSGESTSQRPAGQRGTVRAASDERISERSERGAASERERLGDVAERDNRGQALTEAQDKLRSAKENVQKGVEEAGKAILTIIRSDKNTLGATLPFSDETYQQLKPHFKTALSHFSAAAVDVRDAVRALIQYLKTEHGASKTDISDLQEYILKFVGEVQSGEEKLAAEKPQKAAAPTVTGNELQTPYQPQSTMKGLDTLVPVNMQTATRQALERVEKKHGAVDAFVAKELGYDLDTMREKGYFAAEQIDTLALALDNIKDGRGFIVGSQTGVGKGRIVAGILKYALENGKTPIFVTEKPNLYADMFRDLTDIGIDPDTASKIFATNNALSLDLDENGAYKLKTEAKAKHARELAKVTNEGALTGHNFVFTTYNQMQTIKGQRTQRHDLLEALAPNAIVVFDESHNAGGTEGRETKTRKNAVAEVLDRAKFARQLVRDASAVFYSSATYAKRPSVMDLYAKTDMRHAIAGGANLSETVTKGGVPLQQAVASMLVEAGQYIRHEKSFDGIKFDKIVVNVDKTLAENLATGLRKIFEFDTVKQAVVAQIDHDLKLEGRAVTHDGSVGKAGASSSNFTSIMHNLIGQMLLTVKLDASIDRAVKAFEAGEKPVIALASTMESFLARYVDEFGIQTGEGINLDFGAVLDRYLERSIEVIEGDAFGKKKRRRLTDEELGEAGMRAYKIVKKTIRDMDWSSLPISPIDYLHTRLKDAGMKGGEITGRKRMLDYSGDIPIYGTRPSTDTKAAGRRKILQKYNDGDYDYLIINQAGAVGLSAHASSTYKDQKPRTMFVLQAEANIDTFMQMLGRINRTGQVVLPRYEMVVADIPAELRPSALLLKKLGMLNANTTGSKKGKEDTDALDFINEYGDRIVAEMMEDMPDVHNALGRPLKGKESGDGLEIPEAARKVSGRIPLLPIKQQEELYAQIEDVYRTLITQLDAMGENMLEAKTFDLDAKTIEKTEIYTDTSEDAGMSPFTAPAYLEKVDVKKLGKPFTRDQVVEQLSKRLDLGENPSIQEIQEAGKKATLRMMEGAMNDFDRYEESEIFDRVGEKDAQVVINAAEDDRTFIPEQYNAATGEIDQHKTNRMQHALDHVYRLRGVRQMWRRALDPMQIGDRVKLRTLTGETYGVILDIKRKGSTKNPVALGDWDILFATTDASRQIKVKLRKIGMEHPTDEMVNISRLATGAVFFEPAQTVEVVENDEAKQFDIYDYFDHSQTENRETRQIITGNLLAGYSMVKKGQILYFTDENGTLRHGVLMAKDYDFAKESEKLPVHFPQNDKALQFLQAHPNYAIIKSQDEALSVRYAYGKFIFLTPASKQTGGQYFLDQKVRDIAGDFVKVGGMMRNTVEDDLQALDVMNAYSNSGVTWISTAMKDEARAFLKPKETLKSVLLGEAGSVARLVEQKKRELLNSKAAYVRINDLDDIEQLLKDGVELYVDYRDGFPISASLELSRDKKASIFHAFHNNFPVLAKSSDLNTGDEYPSINVGKTHYKLSAVELEALQSPSQEILKHARTEAGENRLRELREIADLSTVLPDVGVINHGIYLEITPEAAEIVNASFDNAALRRDPNALPEIPNDGVTLEPDQTEVLLKELKDFEELARVRGYSDMLSGVQALRENIKNHAKRHRGVVALVVFDDRVPHEGVHWADIRGATSKEGLKSREARYGDKEQYLNDPNFQTAWISLNAIHGHRLSTGTALSETFAYLATRDYAQLGLTRDQAADLLTKMITGYYQTNGPNSLKYFSEVDARDLHETIEREIYAENKQAKTKKPKRKGKGDNKADEDGGAGDKQSESAEKGGRKTSGRTELASFPQTLQERGFNVEDIEYQRQSHAQTRALANAQMTAYGRTRAVQNALDNLDVRAESTNVLTREIERLARLHEMYVVEGNKPEADAIDAEMSDLVAATTARLINIGRAEEAVKMLAPMSPESMLITATRMKQVALKDENVTLLPDERDKIRELAEELKKVRIELEKALAKPEEKIKTSRKKSKTSKDIIDEAVGSARRKRTGARLMTREDTAIEKAIAPNFAAAVEKFRALFSIDLRIPEEETVKSVLKSAVKDEEISELVGVAATVLFHGLKNYEIYGTMEFQAEMVKLLGDGVKPFLGELQAKAQIRLDVLRRNIRAERARNKYRTENEEENLTDEEIDQILADEKKEDRQKGREKTRAKKEHKSAAEVFQRNEKITAKLEEMDVSAEIAYAAILLFQKGRTLEKVMRAIMDEFGVSLPEAHTIGVEAQKIAEEIKKGLAKDSDLTDEELADRAAAQQLKVDQRKAELNLKNFLTQLVDQKNAMQRFNNAIRTLFVANLATQTYNAVQSVVGSAPREVLIDLYDSAFRKARRTANLTNALDEIAPEVPLSQILKTWGYVWTNKRQLAERILADFPDDFFQIFNHLQGDIELSNQFADRSSKIRKGIDYIQKYANILARMSFAQLQERHFRSAVFAASVRQQITAQGKNFDRMIAESDFTSIPQSVIDEAVQKALRVTYAETMNPRVKEVYDFVDRIVPVFINPVVYARFTYTVTKAVVNAHAFGIMDAQFLGGKGYTTRSLATGFYGLTFIGIAYAMLSYLGGDDDEWYTLYLFGEDNPPVDIRRWFPISPYFYTAALIKRLKEGKNLPPFSSFLEGYASIEYKYFERSPGYELFTALWEKLRGQNNWEDVGASGARFGGHILSTGIRYLKPLRDIVASVDAESAALRNYGDTARGKFAGELAKTLPGLDRLYNMPKRLSPVTGDPVEQIAPIASAVGLKFVNLEFTSPKRSAAEEIGDEVNAKNFSGGGEMTEDERQVWAIKKEIKDAVRFGQLSQAEGKAKVNEYKESGKLTKRQADILKDVLKMSDLEESIHWLKVSNKEELKDLRRILSAASDEEKAKIKDDLNKKLKNKKKGEIKTLMREMLAEFGLMKEK